MFVILGKSRFSENMKER